MVNIDIYVLKCYNEVIMTMMPFKSSRFEAVNTRSPFKKEIDNPDLTRIGSHEHIDVYGTESLIDELKIVMSLGGIALNNVFHATRSLALPGIKHHGAILSSKQLVEAHDPIVTGEYTTDMGEMHRIFGGLDDVYAGSDPIEDRYAGEGSTGEFPVIFGIDHRSLPNRPYIGQDTGDGYRLGPRVPITSITTQIAPYDALPEMKKWSEDNNINPVTMSWDAAAAITYLGLRNRQK